MGQSWHFVGIGGIGMSAIARILLARGEQISGSDESDSPLIAQLREEGAKISIGHRAGNVNGASGLVVSSAIDLQNPEYCHALERGIPILKRGEMLRRIMQGRAGIAICGTHGKTTSTAMAAAVLRAGGIDADLVLGGIDVATGTNAHAGAAPYFLTEADESDGSFALLEPHVAVVTNIENDHLSCDEELQQLVASFAAFLGKIPEGGTAVVGVDNSYSRSIANLERAANTVTFAIDTPAHVRAANISYHGMGSSFDVVAGRVCLGNVTLNVPGAINIQNALAAICIGRALEIPFARTAAALMEFRGVRRRFEILTQTSRMTVVDDYAHHPTAVRETIAAARRFHQGTIVAAFQPHRYSRTKYLSAEFADALGGADIVFLAPVYAASESPLDGVSERNIGERLEKGGTPVVYAKYVHDLRGLIQTQAPEGALVLMLGAGNISKVAGELARDVAELAGR